MFRKKVESFTCEKCGNLVFGNGYTNHCSKCLWSKHVDLLPGDRKSGCGGMMKPINFSKEKMDYVLTHECVICGHTKRNKMSPDDDFDKAVLIVSQSKQLI